MERLARRAGGECEIGNQVDGGLQVAMTFPFDPAARTVPPRRAGAPHEERVLTTRACFREAQSNSVWSAEAASLSTVLYVTVDASKM